MDDGVKNDATLANLALTAAEDFDADRGQPGGGDLFKRTFDVARRLRGELAHLVHAPGERRGVRLQVDGECADCDAHC